MKKKWIYILLLIVILTGGFAYTYFTYIKKDTYVEPMKNLKKTNPGKQLEDVNKFLVEKDMEKIKSFLRRRGWEMNHTQSGLWYSVTSKGTGEKVEYGDYIKLKYQVRLLDGTLMYSSDSTGIKVIHVGRGQEIKGLHEGLQYLSEGDEARFIIPPHLGHGLLGDSKRIPARSILYYDVEVLEVSDAQFRQ